jgi:hypothetical protein
MMKKEPAVRLVILFIAFAAVAAGLISTRADLATAITLLQVRQLCPGCDTLTLRYLEDGWVSFELEDPSAQARAEQETESPPDLDSRCLSAGPPL